MGGNHLKTPAEYGSLNNTFNFYTTESPYSKWMSQYIVLQFSSKMSTK